MPIPITRRDVLRSASLSALAALLPPGLRSAEWLARTVTPQRAVVLLEMFGGNDGINMVVPYGDPVYQTQRGNYLKLTTTATDTRKRVVSFDTLSGATALPKPAGFGVHYSLANLLTEAWQAGDMAVVQGVGYPDPSRSHFRGADIWNAGATDDQPAIGTGWMNRLLTAEGVDPAGKTDAIILSRAFDTPMRGAGLKPVSMNGLDGFIRAVNGLPTPTAEQLATTNPSLAYLLRIQAIATGAGNQFSVANGLAFTTVFPNNDLGRQAKAVAQCIAADVVCPFYKIAIGGFDNHTNQINKHADLLAQVAAALAALRAALIEKGRWNDVLVLTSSEFGRRLGENDSQGTDHGAAAPHLMLGGALNGGLYGTYPSLSALDARGDLQFSTDFRSYFATAAAFLGITAANRAQALEPFHTPPAVTYAPIAGLLA